MPRYFGRFNKMLETNESGYLVGKRITGIPKAGKFRSIFIHDVSTDAHIFALVTQSLLTLYA